MNKPIKTAFYRMGENARLRDRSRFSNPFGKRTLLHPQWDAGWVAMDRICPDKVEPAGKGPLHHDNVLRNVRLSK